MFDEGPSFGLTLCCVCLTGGYACVGSALHRCHRRVRDDLLRRGRLQRARLHLHVLHPDAHQHRCGARLGIAPREHYSP